MAGSLSRILTDVRFSLLQFGRSRQALFFTQNESMTVPCDQIVRRADYAANKQ